MLISYGQGVELWALRTTSQSAVRIRQPSIYSSTSAKASSRIKRKFGSMFSFGCRSVSRLCANILRSYLVVSCCWWIEIRTDYIGQSLLAVTVRHTFLAENIILLFERNRRSLICARPKSHTLDHEPSTLYTLFIRCRTIGDSVGITRLQSHGQWPCVKSLEINV